ncbi:hypothetical protein [Nonomuraea roseoviolacea]|uniref:MFS transporter n=1 Tax=Nonomuraea roseoviolacea subsp. carminata TaxID=160689 RepID=A0ABT1K656_9ACTN|nr:hypothetical protein [Nonomuraea roseoviolacea]MCP2349487.1 hypothetical protein [Nonomuraea roseoviolacea subsp. carminata]
MAVPPIQRTPNQPATGSDPGTTHPWFLDIVLALLIVAALPLAIVAIPNTVSVVGDLLPPGFDRLGLMRAHGLALPAMMLTVPLASVALGRVRVAYILVAGLALLAVADAAGGYAGSTFLVGVLRVLHGVGAGLLLPATLVAAWERPAVLRAVWSGVLALSLLSAQALALWPLDGVSDWKVTLQPYPMLTGAALVLAAAYLVLWLLYGRRPAPRPQPRERSRLLLATMPAAGIAIVAISTASEDWRPNIVIVVAVLAVGALLALASIGVPEARSLAYVMVAVGAVLLPSIAQVTYVEMGGLGGPGLKGLWGPFGVAGGLAVAAAVLVRLFVRGEATWPAPLGLLSMVVGLCSVRVVVPAADGRVLVVPFTLLAVGAAVALTASLRRAGVGTALFGLALCFPGVLAGYLLGSGVQMAMLRGVSTPQQLVDRFVGALHMWALIGGFLVVAVIVLAALLSRRGPGSEVVGVDEGPEGPSGGGRLSDADADADAGDGVTHEADQAGGSSERRVGVSPSGRAGGLSGDSPGARSESVPAEAPRGDVAGDGARPAGVAGAGGSAAAVGADGLISADGAVADGGPGAGVEGNGSGRLGNGALGAFEASPEVMGGTDGGERREKALRDAGGRRGESSPAAGGDGASDDARVVGDEDAPTGAIPRVPASTANGRTPWKGSVPAQTPSPGPADGSGTFGERRTAPGGAERRRRPPAGGAPETGDAEHLPAVPPQGASPEDGTQG